MKLNDDQRDWVKRCVKKAGFSISQLPKDGQLSKTPKELDDFISRIENSIETYHATSGKRPTYRQTHDQLRRLYALAYRALSNEVDDDSDNRDLRVGGDGDAVRVRDGSLRRGEGDVGDHPAGEATAATIRAALNSLGSDAVAYLSGRARRLIPRMFPGETAEQGILRWAEDASGPKLIEAAFGLTSHGGRFVNPSRGPHRLEPIIMGKARGDDENNNKGGRPKNDALQKLVRHLAFDWSQLTGDLPETTRSDATGFGDLVYWVIDWIGDWDDPSEAASNALRSYLRGQRQSLSPYRTPEDEAWWNDVWKRFLS